MPPDRGSETLAPIDWHIVPSLATDPFAPCPDIVVRTNHVFWKSFVFVL